MYREYLEALNYGNKEDADRTYDRFKRYVETKTETNFRQLSLDPFAGNLGDLIFGKQ